MPPVPRPEIDSIGSNPSLPGLSTNAPSASFGVSNQPATMELADTALKLVEKHASMADQVHFTDINSKMKALSNQIEIQTSNLKGKDAFAASSLAATQWENGVNEILKTEAPNNRVYRAVDESRKEQWNQLNKQVGFHVNQQANEYENGVIIGQIENTNNQMALRFKDPMAVQQGFKDLESLFNQKMVRDGLDKSDPQFQMLWSKVVGDSLNRVVDQSNQAGNYPLAKTYFDKYKGALDNDDLSKIGEKMEMAETSFYVQDAWNKTPSRNLISGLQKLESNTLLSPKQKLVAESEYTHKWHEWDFRKSSGEIARFKSFEENVLKWKEQGKPMDYALGQVPTYSAPYEYQRVAAERMNEIVYENYIGKKKDDDPILISNVQSAIWGGKITPAQIDELPLSETEKLKLHQYSIDKENGNLDKTIEQTKSDYSAQANQLFANDPETLKTVLYLLESGSKQHAKSSSDYVKYAKQVLADASSKGMTVREWRALLDGKTLGGASDTWGEPLTTTPTPVVTPVVVEPPIMVTH